VNTYDPADDIVYVHIPREPDPCATGGPSTRSSIRLPAGYANTSQRTHLEPRRSSAAAVLS